MASVRELKCFTIRIIIDSAIFLFYCVNQSLYAERVFRVLWTTPRVKKNEMNKDFSIIFSHCTHLFMKYLTLFIFPYYEVSVDYIELVLFTKVFSLL